MWGRHLKRRGRWWHYHRYVPKRYQGIDDRRLVCFTLRTSDITMAKQKAANISAALEQEWEQALVLGEQIAKAEPAARYQAAVAVQTKHQLTPKPAEQISNQELIDRLRLIFTGEVSQSEQPAVLGLVDQPKLSMKEAFDRFWDHIADEWRGLSHDQRRVKRNACERALSNFEKAVGKIALYDLERRHALAFRTWWIERLNKTTLKPQSGNKDFNALRRLVTINFDIDGHEKPNPFARVRLKAIKQETRSPFSTEQIEGFLKPRALEGLQNDFWILFRLLINTGMRPVEGIGLELADLNLDTSVPYLYVRANSIRQLKTPHSERQIPLLGVSLQAAKELVKQDGWGKRAGKNMYATACINRALKASPVALEENQTLYSLRHWFQDQLTKRDVVDRAQAQLMGHKFHRPKYGFGKDLSELREIIEPFSL